MDEEKKREITNIFETSLVQCLLQSEDKEAFYEDSYLGTKQG